MLMMAAPLTARADIIHTISASTQLRVDAAATDATKDWINLQCASIKYYRRYNGWFRTSK